MTIPSALSFCSETYCSLRDMFTIAFSVWGRRTYLSNNLPFFIVLLGGATLSPLSISTTIGLLYQPRIIDDDECGAVGGMRIDWWNRRTRRKPAPMPLCPPQIPHVLTWARIRPAAVGSRLLTARAMVRPYPSLLFLIMSSVSRVIKILWKSFLESVLMLS
jgi:hypothetical protein